MSQYSIADLEKLSGIKAHTIRIWEQRHGLLKPQRTATNIRYYDDDQLRMLLNVSALLRNGMKISQISSLSETEMYSKLDQLSTAAEQTEGQFAIYVNQLISSGITYNEAQFEKTFSTCLLRHGLHDTYIKVIYPLLEKLGLMWGKEEMNAAQEHFVSNLLKQKMFTAIDGLPPLDSSAKSVVLFLPEEEDHEMGLLFANYLFRSKGFKVIYLGQRVPLPNLEQAVSFCKPDFLMTFFVRSQPIELAQNYLTHLSSVFLNYTILISGNSWVLGKLILPENVVWLRSVDHFNKWVGQEY